MTDITPTSGQLVSRQAAQPAALTPPAQAPHLGAFKPENLQIAEQLARATDMLPRGYHGKPGACLLLLDWCERNGVSLLEAAGEISFVQGKPNIGARLQKQLAARHGYRTKKVKGDERSCTVAVFDPDGNESGRFTYTIELAERLGLTKRNEMYAKDPAQMLWHRATARALDHFGPGELAPVMADALVDLDPADVAQLPEPETEAEGTEAPSDVADETPFGDVTVEDLKAAIRAAGRRQADAVKHVADTVGDQFVSLTSIARNQAATDALLEWL